MNYLHDFVEEDDNAFATHDRFNFDPNNSSDCDQAYDNAIIVRTAFCKDQLFKPKQDQLLLDNILGRCLQSIGPRSNLNVMIMHCSAICYFPFSPCIEMYSQDYRCAKMHQVVAMAAQSI